MASTSQPTTIGSGGKRKQREEEAATWTGGSGSQLVMPEDGYEWKKYGQKFIKNIQKTRSYFRCRDKRCGAKKKVEWHPDDPGSEVRIVYDGTHQHGSPSTAAGPDDGDGAANRYELRAQYFGGPARSDQIS